MRTRGFTLIEVVIAIALLVALSIGAATLLSLTLNTLDHSRQRAMALVLARSKLEQLVSLTSSVRDVESGPPPSPADTLTTSREGYVDYLDAQGQSVPDGAAAGAAATVPAAACYVRRWAVERTGGGASELLIVQVMVTTAASARAGAAAFGRSDRDAVWISGARLRRGA
jgi:prepilin-type N-terminal cleavage/methylation domain-containing protein